MKHQFLAVDLGATSGRTVLGTVTDDVVTMKELTRFGHDIVSMGNHRYWDFPHLYNEIENALSLLASQGITPTSIGIDTWGVDIVCFGDDGLPLANPFSYRDPHTADEPARFFRDCLPSEHVYDLTGIQVMNFNTLFQLSAMKRDGNSALNAARRIMFLPDALSYLLCGIEVTEYTIASTSQLLNPTTRRIEPALLSALGLQPDIFPPLIMPATVIGRLTPAVSHRTGMAQIPVISVAGHDTASAVVAIPATDESFAYLSSGTWSLMGIEVPQPIINDDSCVANFTNEGGVDGTTRFLKNICGMWLLESCRNEWEKEGLPTDFDTLFTLSDRVTDPMRSIIFPDAAEFGSPVSMLDAIRTYCRESGQPVPETQGEITRCILVSLALRYRQVMEMLKRFAPFPIKRLHIIGGGSRNERLNRMTADVLRMPVVAGPVECTALGNVMLQAKAAGVVSNLERMRAVIRKSVELKEFQPSGENNELWDEAYARFLTLPK